MAERFLLQLEGDRADVVEAALAGGTIERYLEQMESGNTEVRAAFSIRYESSPRQSKRSCKSGTSWAIDSSRKWRKSESELSTEF